jgi:O-antigen/teichoic acid export membrane protein
VAASSIEQSAAPVAETQSGLGRRFGRSVRDNVVAECVIQGVRVGAMIVLARALGAAEFGVFRVLLVVGMIAITALEPGLVEALVQRKDLTAVHESSAWFASLALGLAGVAALYAGSGLIASMMAMPQLKAGVKLICIPILLDCAAVTSNAWLQRELRFGVLAGAEVAAEIAFMAVSLGLLWTPLWWWSLIAGLSARLATRAIVLLAAAPRLPRTWPTHAALHDLRGFAAGVWGGNVLNVVSGNADYILVGRLLGATELGFYVLAWDLLRFVPDRLYKVAGRVAFPAFCLLQDNDAELSRSYLSFVGYIAKVVLPMAACAAVAAPELIGTVYGARWLPSAQPLRLLSVGLALLGLRNGIGAVYYAKGRPALDIYLHGARLVLLAAAVWSLSGLGLLGISAGMSAVESTISIGGLLIAAALANLALRDLILAILPGLRLALACAVAAAAGKALAMVCGVSGPLVLLFVALPPAVIFVWLEGQTLGAIVGGAFDFNKVARTQLSRS